MSKKWETLPQWLKCKSCGELKPFGYLAVCGLDGYGICPKCHKKGVRLS